MSTEQTIAEKKETTPKKFVSIDIRETPHKIPRTIPITLIDSLANLRLYLYKQNSNYILTCNEISSGFEFTEFESIWLGFKLFASPQNEACQLPGGDGYVRSWPVTEAIINGKSVGRTINDYARIICLYSQIHSAYATGLREYPFEFYSPNENTIQKIQDFFSRYNGLLPPGLKLDCYHYSDTQVQKIGKTITGNVNNEYDPCFSHTIHLLIEIAGDDLNNLPDLTQIPLGSFLARRRQLIAQAQQKESPPLEQSKLKDQPALTTFITPNLEVLRQPITALENELQKLSDESTILKIRMATKTLLEDLYELRADDPGYRAQVIFIVNTYELSRESLSFKISSFHIQELLIPVIFTTIGFFLFPTMTMGILDHSLANFFDHFSQGMNDILEHNMTHHAIHLLSAAVGGLGSGLISLGVYEMLFKPSPYPVKNVIDSVQNNYLKP